MPKPNKGEAKQDFLKRCTAEMTAEGNGTDQAYAMCNAYWDEETGNKRSVMNLAAPLEFSEPEREGGERGFLITAYTGAELDSWFGPIVIAIDGIKTKAKFPILREHNRTSIVGWAKKAWSEGANLFIQGAFSKTARASKDVMALADEGFPWQASIGVRPKKIRAVKPNETFAVNGRELKGPVEVWLESEVAETSFVALGADSDTAAIALTDQGRMVPVEIVGNEHEPHSKEAHDMPINMEQLEKDAPDLLNEIRAAAKDEGVESGRTEGAKAERERIKEILAAGGDPEVARKAIEEGTAPADVYKLFFEAEKAKRAEGLQNLAAQATPPVNSQKGADQNKAATFADKVDELMRAEGLTKAKATRRVIDEFPELHKQYLNSLNG